MKVLYTHPEDKEKIKLNTFLHGGSHPDIDNTKLVTEKSFIRWHTEYYAISDESISRHGNTTRSRVERKTTTDCYRIANTGRFTLLQILQNLAECHYYTYGDTGQTLHSVGLFDTEAVIMILH